MNARRRVLSILPAALISLFATGAAQAQIPAPKPAEPPPSTEIRFIADPVSDGAVLTLGLGFAALSELTVSTGELAPQEPTSKSHLLGIDRTAVGKKHDPLASTVSNVGLFGAIAFAAVDPLLSGYRDGAEAGLLDAFMYAESITLAWASTNLAKIAVRRPRPEAYDLQEKLKAEAEATGQPQRRVTDTDNTNYALSFYSGHAAITASIAATATYLAFARAEKGSARPWITLIVGTLATGIVSYTRVQSGKHFPTDVIAGSMAGAGIGLLVPHLHREADARQRAVWIGMAPVDGGAGLSAATQW
jgi:hypothetical protein